MHEHNSSMPERNNSEISRVPNISNPSSRLYDDDNSREVPAGNETAPIKLAALSIEGSGVPRASSDIEGPASNILAQVLSRISTRNLPEPPPPPDGGLKAVGICLPKPGKLLLVMSYLAEEAPPRPSIVAARIYS
jgi:hypothetical protein